jgi:glycosyltransferase involved in cell wall biosynthesis
MNITIVIPVYNEEKILEKSIIKVYNYCKKNVKYNWKIVIADNASNDKTREIGMKISKKLQAVQYFYLNKKGRGLALKKAWIKNISDINIYFDVDLATDLSAVSKAIQEIEKGADIVIGNRYDKKSKTVRLKFRLFLSKSYNYLVKFFFIKTKIFDFQCGFKAVKKEIVQKIITKVNDNEWFFDTELLLLAEKYKFKISQIPVIWKEMGDTKVSFFKDILKFIKKLFLLRIRI